MTEITTADDPKMLRPATQQGCCAVPGFGPRVSVSPSPACSSPKATGT
nr:hypothetical protein [Methyloceanibacter stevinii]